MKLTDIKNGNLSAEWAEKGYELPKFDVEAVKAKTHAEPTWVHFGAGNIFRAFPAAILNDALNSGKYDRGVIVAESFDYEIIDKAYQPYDNSEPAGLPEVHRRHREEGHRLRHREPEG